MNKSEILSEMRNSRLRWDHVLSQIEEHKMTEPSLHGGWSVKDTIGHVAYYERWLLTWLEDAVRGKVTVATHRDELNPDERNAIVYIENKDRDLDDILTQSRLVNDRLYQFVWTIPERDLFDPHAFERYIVPFWGKTQPLWQCIAGDSWEHYAEHSTNLELWLARVNSEKNGSDIEKPVRELSNILS